MSSRLMKVLMSMTGRGGFRCQPNQSPRGRDRLVMDRVVERTRSKKGKQRGVWMGTGEAMYKLHQTMNQLPGFYTRELWLNYRRPGDNLPLRTKPCNIEPSMSPVRPEDYPIPITPFLGRRIIVSFSWGAHLIHAGKIICCILDQLGSAQCDDTNNGGNLLLDSSGTQLEEGMTWSQNPSTDGGCSPTHTTEAKPSPTCQPYSNLFGDVVVCQN